MDFEPRLRRYLEGSPRTAEAPARLREIDAAALYAHLLDRLRTSEPLLPTWQLKQLHRTWTAERVARFARYLETVPSPLAGAFAEGRGDLAAHLLDQAIGLTMSPELGLVDQLELARIARGFEDGTIEQYACETRLVTGTLPNVLVTELGRAFLRLRGKDAIRWLLTVEVLQSTGDWDPWRTPRELLEASCRGFEAIFVKDDWYFLYAPDTLERLRQLGVLSPSHITPDKEIRRYLVRDAMIDVVHAVLEPGPWHTAVSALLEDERVTVVPQGGTSASEAVADLTKLITHEVRNALVPVRHHIDALRMAGAEGAVRDRIEKARRGVVRVLEFIDGVVTTSDLVGPATSCDVREVIGEALAAVEGGERFANEPSEPYRVRAPRSRLVDAVRNVLLNALQAAPEGPVRVRCRTVGTDVQIVVDDGGPGIPPELRSRVFDDGYTTRGGPGHGLGLGIVRRVVEATLRGRVWCEESDLGGARFVLSIAAEAKP